MQVGLSGAGAFAGLLAVASLNIGLLGRVNLPLLLGCFGASATLLFGAHPYIEASRGVTMNVASSTLT